MTESMRLAVGGVLTGEDQVLLDELHPNTLCGLGPGRGNGSLARRKMIAQVPLPWSFQIYAGGEPLRCTARTCVHSQVRFFHQRLGLAFMRRSYESCPETLDPPLSPLAMESLPSALVAVLSKHCASPIGCHHDCRRPVGRGHLRQIVEKSVESQTVGRPSAMPVEWRQSGAGSSSVTPPRDRGAHFSPSLDGVNSGYPRLGVGAVRVAPWKQ